MVQSNIREPHKSISCPSLHLNWNIDYYFFMRHRHIRHLHSSCYAYITETWPRLYIPKSTLALYEKFTVNIIHKRED